MKKIMYLALVAISAVGMSCEKDKISSKDDYGKGPRTQVPTALQGNWMYGNFSMTEYWNQNPADYLGNAFEMAVAFTFHADGTYDHYFTSKTVSAGISTYHQSITKGTLEVDEASKTLTMHAVSAHYQQTRNGTVTENRDLREDEITKKTIYHYELKTEPNGTPAIYLKMNGTGNAFPFLKRP
jgi:hypothetical protein